MTAAELRAIGERVSATAGTNDWRHADDDRARLYAALERLLNERIYPAGDGAWFLRPLEKTQRIFSAKDAAIDALLREQPQ